MLDAVRGFSASRQNGLFINSCFAHCQSERQDTWYANNSPRLGNKVHTQKFKQQNISTASVTWKHFIVKLVYLSLINRLQYLVVCRKSLTLLGIGSSRGETRSTQTAHTLAMALAIILCSGETIKIILRHKQFHQMVKGTDPNGYRIKTRYRYREGARARLAHVCSSVDHMI